MSETREVARRFLITGHPRSGTMYMARLIRKMGWRVQHELLGKDGISAWMLAGPDIETRWLPLVRSECTFKHVIQVVRDPKNVIPSSCLAENGLPYRQEYVNPEGYEGFAATANSWIRWNQIIREQKPDVIVNVERAGSQLAAWLASKFLLRNKCWRIGDMPPTNTNTREYTAPPWEEIWESFVPELQDRLQEEAALYNYEVK